jgi:hypothetical protein
MWDSKMWSWDPRNSELKMTELVMTNSNSPYTTHFPWYNKLSAYEENWLPPFIKEEVPLLSTHMSRRGKKSVIDFEDTWLFWRGPTAIWQTDRLKPQTCSHELVVIPSPACKDVNREAEVSPDLKAVKKQPPVETWRILCVL